MRPTLPEVALLGRSNVGKSSLLNALVHRKDIARTSKRPGKTRDCNVYHVEDRLYLVDLPGYGYARISHGERRRLERLIDDYLTQRGTLVGVVWLLDVRRDPSALDLAMADRLAGGSVPVLLTVTKSDKLGRGRRLERVRAIRSTLRVPDDQTVVTSARTGEGIRELRDAIMALAREAAA